MEQPIFKLPRVGLVGGRPVDRSYMEEIERRAKRVEDACRYVPPVADREDGRQLVLPFPKPVAGGL